uniref:MAD2L1 binding protein n=1 Tax=Pan troglodytes TaxID=9598 RepID=A0A2I3SSZ6_PANTR
MPSQTQYFNHCTFFFFFSRRSLTLSPRLEHNGMTSAHHNFRLPGSRDSPASASQVAEIIGMHQHAWLILRGFSMLVRLWFEKSEETHASQIELLETSSMQEPLNASEAFCPRDCMVPVVFPGPVSQEGCCQFTCELLKHIMYQRQQLPLPYEQLKHFYRKPSPQAEEMLKKKPRATTEVSSRKCQQALAELESVLSHLEDFFARTLVPRVLILLGGNALSPKEFYELDLSLLAPYSVDQSLSTAACLRRLFRAIFMADAFSELQAPPLMGTVVMAQGHRNCGEDWFRPKLNYRVPSRGHKLTVTLSCGRPSIRTTAWEDYIWFQAPVTLKGFRE